MKSIRYVVFSVVILIGLTALSMAVSADPAVIDFEDLSTGGPGQGGQVAVTNQYAGKGITFNGPLAFDYAKGLAIPGFARSGTKAIETCYGGEFCTQKIEMSFTRAETRIKVWVGYSARHEDDIIVILRAFDAGGNEIGQKMATLAPTLTSQPIPIQMPLEVTSQSANITRATVGLFPDTGDNPSFNNGLAVDDVEFGMPQLYLFSGSEYARYDILQNKYEGKASISQGYAGVPFSTIDAAYVDTWHY